MGKENGICCKCKHRFCLRCEETYHENTKCDETVLKNLNEVKKTCKKCPSCFTYITRTEGCAHMICSFCGASFDWNNPETIQKNYKEKYEIFYKDNDLELLDLKKVKKDKKL